MIADLLEKVIPALVVSALVSVGVSIKDQSVQQRLLEDNLKVTKSLAETVQEIQITLAVFGERYITKAEVQQLISKRGDPDGARSRDNHQ